MTSFMFPLLAFSILVLRTTAYHIECHSPPWALPPKQDCLNVLDAMYGKLYQGSPFGDPDGAPIWGSYETTDGYIGTIRVPIAYRLSKLNPQQQEVNN